MNTSTSEPIYYADTSARVDKVVDAIYRAMDRGDEPVGLDTEFEGVNVGKQNCIALSRCVLISVAVKAYPRRLSPRGYDHADAAVLPATSLEHQRFRDVLQGPATKVLHNAGVDIHTLANHGVELTHVVNTLDLARFTWPARARGPGFTLDALGNDFLGAGKSTSYKELVLERVQVPVSKTTVQIVCECGARPCRKRRTTPGHARVEKEVTSLVEKEEEREIPLSVLASPDHPRFPRLLEYAARDAVLALGVYDLAMATLSRTFREMPW